MTTESLVIYTWVNKTTLNKAAIAKPFIHDVK